MNIYDKIMSPKTIDKPKGFTDDREPPKAFVRTRENERETVRPEERIIPEPPRLESPSKIWNQRSRLFNLIVIPLPIIAGAIYFYGFASDAYVVQSIYAIRNPTSSMAQQSAPMTFAGGSTTAERAIDESYAVVNYIRSRSAFEELEKGLNLSSRFSVPSIDWLGRLPENATSEQRYQYYTKHVTVSYNDVEGQINLDTRAYDAETAFQMSQLLAKASEKLVNEFNERARSDLIKLAEEQVAMSAAQMRQANDAITAFQQQNSTIDPSMDVASLNSVITQLRGETATKQAQRNALGDDSTKTGPRATETNNLLKALQSQIAAEQARLTGQTDAVAPLINKYKLLSVDQQLMQQKYSASISMLQNAQLQAEHQKLYIVNVVSPSQPDQPVLPDRHRRMLEIIALTAVSWLILRMIFASVRDHRI